VRSTAAWRSRQKRLGWAVVKSFYVAGIGFAVLLLGVVIVAIDGSPEPPLSVEGPFNPVRAPMFLFTAAGAIAFAAWFLRSLGDFGARPGLGTLSGLGLTLSGAMTFATMAVMLAATPPAAMAEPIPPAATLILSIAGVALSAGFVAMILDHARYTRRRGDRARAAVQLLLAVPVTLLLAALLSGAANSLAKVLGNHKP
jgi:hypothetical protein